MSVAKLQDHFVELTDPRKREVTYPLINIVVIAICGVICGADDFVAIAKWGRSKRDWLAKFLDLSSGIPSHDRFNAIFAALSPAEFEKCWLGWITTLHELTDGQIIPIDGKTLRRSIDAAIHNTIRNGKESSEVRYYMLSRYVSAKRFAEAVRKHGAIENRLPWQLDVTFQEDQCRIRKGHADANFSSLRRTALSLLKNETSNC